MSAPPPPFMRGPLDESSARPDPFAQFARWFDEARAADPAADPTAMTLATATQDGAPSARIVLLKAFDADGFTFHTNYRSRKGRELADNPRVALVVHWPWVGRQVRIEGIAARVSPSESDAYFATRPPRSRLSALASPQSEVVPDRAALDARLAAVEQDLAGRTPARPEHWGGIRVVPGTIEFWQSHADRLHDRLRYRRRPEGGWAIDRLAP